MNGEPDQQAIIIDDCYDIHIRVDGNTDIINALTFKERTKVQITENIADDFEDEFILQTAAELPAGECRLELSYRKSGKRLHSLFPVAFKSITLAGTYMPVNESLQSKALPGNAFCRAPPGYPRGLVL